MTCFIRRHDGCSCDSLLGDSNSRITAKDRSGATYSACLPLDYLSFSNGEVDYSCCLVEKVVERVLRDLG